MQIWFLCLEIKMREWTFESIKLLINSKHIPYLQYVQGLSKSVLPPSWSRGVSISRCDGRQTSRISESEHVATGCSFSTEHRVYLYWHLGAAPISLESELIARSSFARTWWWSWRCTLDLWVLSDAFELRLRADEYWNVCVGRWCVEPPASVVKWLI